LNKEEKPFTLNETTIGFRRWVVYRKIKERYKK